MLKALFTCLGLSLCALGYLSTTNNPVLAQVTSDDTVNTQVTENGNTAEITGGETRGDNLFHSFQDFSVETGNEAFFNNADSISNIFSRVTGGNVSDIDGAIRANGSASLFLINPAGIIFGENASLNIGGSFYGSTASGILFEDGEFSAADLDNPPLLTVNAPIGLGFRDNPQSITNRSQANNGNGLQVNTGENITLLGGDINFDGGIVFAPGGNVDLGGLSAAGEIGISNNGSLSFPDDVARSDVSLQNGSIVNVTSGGGGNITVNARNLELQDSAIFAGINSGLGSPDAQAGDINISATNNVSVDGQNDNSDSITAINNSVFDNAIGNAGEINISARNISLTSGGGINSFVNGQGNSSDITLNAGRNISIDGSNDSLNSIVISSVQASGEGNSGTTNITAQNLTLSNGGNISSLVSGVGDTGDLNINVRDSLAVDGEGILSIPSAINSVVALDAQGNSGDIKINTSKLSLRNGGQVNASIFSRGNAGNIDINSTESITLDGRSTQGGIFSQISSTVLPTAEGNGGNIDITSRDFAISNNANVDASTGGRGSGGEINITANNLSLTNGGSVNAFTLGSDPDNITQGNAGDITINIADTLSIAGTSTINFQGQVIETPAGIFASNLGNRIGNAGNIDIKTSKLSVANGGQVVAETSGKGNSGSIEINTENFSITNLARLNTSSTGQGDAGNISVNATNSFTADNQGLITSNVGSPLEEPAVGKVGNIFITARDIGLTGTAQIQAGAFPGARAEATGTVSLTASESISFTGNRTGIFSDNSPGSFGNASNTQLFAPTITLNDGAIIQASNAANGQGGNVTVESDQLILNGSNINADARGNEGNGASISLNVAEDISLQNNSSISARAFNNADGGNLNIDTNFIVAFPSNGNGNDIIASAEQGNGGNITINADSVLGIEERPLNDSTNDINASSEFDLDGSININTSDINPIQGATELPSNVVEVKQTADQTCSADRDGKATNGLAIAGRGGVHPAPDAPLSSENISNENPAQASIPQPLETSQGKIQPARGIKVTKSGKIVLTAYHTNDAGERIPEIKPNCN